MDIHVTKSAHPNKMLDYKSSHFISEILKPEFYGGTFPDYQNIFPSYLLKPPFNFEFYVDVISVGIGWKNFVLFKKDCKVVSACLHIRFRRNCSSEPAESQFHPHFLFQTFFWRIFVFFSHYIIWTSRLFQWFQCK